MYNFLNIIYRILQWWPLKICWFIKILTRFLISLTSKSAKKSDLKFFAAKMQYEMEKKLYQQECHLKLNEQGFS